MQLKDVTQIIKAIIEERDKIPLIINTERYIPNWQENRHGNAMRGGIRKTLRIIEQAPAVDAVAVVRCKDCKYRRTARCPMWFEHYHSDQDDYTEDDGFCHCGERRE